MLLKASIPLSSPLKHRTLVTFLSNRKPNTSFSPSHLHPGPTFRRCFAYFPRSSSFLVERATEGKGRPYLSKVTKVIEVPRASSRDGGGGGEDCWAWEEEDREEGELEEEEGRDLPQVSWIASAIGGEKQRNQSQVSILEKEELNILKEFSDKKALSKKQKKQNKDAKNDEKVPQESKKKHKKKFGPEPELTARAFSPLEVRKAKLQIFRFFKNGKFDRSPEDVSDEEAVQWHRELVEEKRKSQQTEDFQRKKMLREGKIALRKLRGREEKVGGLPSPSASPEEIVSWYSEKVKTNPELFAEEPSEEAKEAEKRRRDRRSLKAFVIGGDFPEVSPDEVGKLTHERVLELLEEHKKQRLHPMQVKIAKLKAKMILGEKAEKMTSLELARWYKEVGCQVEDPSEKDVVKKIGRPRKQATPQLPPTELPNLNSMSTASEEGRGREPEEQTGDRKEPPERILPFVSRRENAFTDSERKRRSTLTAARSQATKAFRAGKLDVNPEDPVRGWSDAEMLDWYNQRRGERRKTARVAKEKNVKRKEEEGAGMREGFFKH